MTTQGPQQARVSACCDVAFPKRPQGRHPELSFRSSIPGPLMPLSTLRRPPRGGLRKTRGQDGSLLLSCETLAFSTSCRFIPTHGRKTLVHGVSRGFRAANRRAPKRGGRCTVTGSLSPRSGAPGAFHSFPALTRWAIFFRPTDSPRPNSWQACEEFGDSPQRLALLAVFLRDHLEHGFQFRQGFVPGGH